ncbi:hypothetical protein [Actinomycetospora cinnamomea]|uniref:Uncharacterized protein n=1 Tax=Actinomycetospora cinnamomea TaxID=663609 RepID=A0A2U1FG65_9PSEU|nr:hypothetical protein [Actinomycetospora cinnamomea]PVZ11139.1 hypothetical protein C8D89_104354 [Actinomycetospora cinnamomea]
MPIRTRRGRAAAYRALWEWPLHSPARLFLVLAAVVAIAAGISWIGGAVGGPEPTGGALGPATTAAPGTVAPAPGAPPVTELRPRILPLSAAPPVALAVAERWTRAWATHPPGTTPQQWSAGLAPYTTEEYLAVLAEVDPANVPGNAVTGPPEAVEVRPEAVRVQVPTDAVRLELLLVQVGPGDWRVSGYDRAS